MGFYKEIEVVPTLGICGGCYNGGVCNTIKKICQCPSDWTGVNCQTQNDKFWSYIGWSALVILMIILLLMALIFCMVKYVEHAKKKKSQSTLVMLTEKQMFENSRMSN